MVMKPDEVPADHLAVVVTYLEMRDRPHVAVPTSSLGLRPGPSDLAAYRALFRAVGSRWLWFSRMVMEDPMLHAILADPAIEILEVVQPDGSTAGLVELDFSEAGEAEISFLGLVPELAGQGHGRWLLAETLHRAWRPEVTRVHLHTCTLDHPAALPAYLSAGFTAYDRSVERFPDPRLLGILPMDCAPQVPVVGTLATASSGPAS
jgi:GNAT superfamily N-acetyltransferase